MGVAGKLGRTFGQGLFKVFEIGIRGKGHADGEHCPAFHDLTRSRRATATVKDMLSGCLAAQLVSKMEMEQIDDISTGLMHESRKCLVRTNRWSCSIPRYILGRNIIRDLIASV